MFRLFLRYLNPGAKVLDLGCGPGIYARMTLDGFAYRRIVGMDFSKRMIQRARKTVPEGFFVHQDVRTAIFYEDSFDVVILASTIFHFNAEELIQLVKRISFALKPDGLLFLSYWNGERSGTKFLDFADCPMQVYYYDAPRIQKTLLAHCFGTLETKSCRRVLRTLDGEEEIEEHYYFGHLLKNIKQVERIRSVVTPPYPYRLPKKKAAA